MAILVKLPWSSQGAALAAENPAPRQQLAVINRKFTGRNRV
jgi:hypothetical protein